MKITLRTFAAVITLTVLFVWLTADAAERPDKTKRQRESIYGVAGTPRWSVLNINNYLNWLRSDAPGALSPAGDNQGVYPRGTGNAIYTDGIYFGAKCYKDAAKTQPASPQLVRVGGKGYGYGLAAGRVTGIGATAVRANPNDADVRIYRVRRDYASMTTDELKRDAAEVNEVPIAEVSDAEIADVVAQYEKDWTAWPVQYGAPYIDRNGNGRYDPPPAFNTDEKKGPLFTADSLISQKRDEPGVSGSDPNSPADQVIWTVSNDLDPATSLAFQSSESVGLELQFTAWGYKRTDALGNLFFKRLKFINKGGVDIGGGVKGAFYLDSMYVCLWSDIDLGSFSDDLAGCDTTLSMGFVYNSNAIDLTYRRFSLPPPASGYDFFQGPKVASPGDSGVFDLKRVRGFKNLPMTSFAYFSAGSPYSDPCNRETAGYLCNTGQWWKMLRGFAPVGTLVTADVPYANGPFPVSKFPLSGDPVTGKGFVDGRGTDYSFPPGDRRILLSTGPFTMAPGDTQEIVVGVVAGLGGDRLSSVAVMKFNDRFAQNTYDALFQVPRPPKAPNVQVAELDGQVILEWGSDLQRVKDIEQTISQPGTFAFEGYNIYQLPSRSSRLSESKRVITYDLPEDPAVVLDEQFDQNTGQILKLPVQFGANSGITRYFSFKKDYIRDIDKIYNGQEYYVAVTAYSVSTIPGYIPAALESTPLVLTVRPKIPYNKVYQSRSGDTLKVTHTGVSDGIVTPIVVDPTRSTGDSYEVRFDTSKGETSWRLVNKTKNTVVLVGETYQGGEDAFYKIIEGGLLLKVEGPPPGMKDWSIPNGNRRVTFADADGLGFEGFETTIGWEAPNNYFNGTGKAVGADKLKNTLLRWAQASAKTTAPTTNGFNRYAGWDENTTTDPNMSYAYRYLRANTGATARPEFAPYIINKTGGYAYQDYKKSVPLSAWDVEANPPVRLAVGFLENNVAGGLVDGKYYPPTNGGGQSNTAGGGPREWLFIFNTPYTGATPNPALQTNILAEKLPVMWWCAFNRRADNQWNEPTGTNEFLILANHINTAADVFAYVTPAPKAGVAVEKDAVKRIGVFPNPYYAFNAAETNRFAKFVTFNNLPPRAVFRIFNLAGQLVGTFEKDDPSTQFFRWDLNNQAGFPVASGIYIVHIDLRLSDGSQATRVLKLAIIQEQEVLDSY